MTGLDDIVIISRVREGPWLHIVGIVQGKRVPIDVPVERYDGMSDAAAENAMKRALRVGLPYATKDVP